MLRVKYRAVGIDSYDQTAVDVLMKTRVPHQEQGVQGLFCSPHHDHADLSRIGSVWPTTYVLLIERAVRENLP